MILHNSQAASRSRTCWDGVIGFVVSSFELARVSAPSGRQKPTGEPRCVWVPSRATGSAQDEDGRMTMLYVEVSLQDLQREFNLALSQPAIGCPPHRSLPRSVLPKPTSPVCSIP